jgi:transcriptional regulator with XRE-family HTH domain
MGPMAKRLTDIDMEIGARIKAFRKTNRLNQTELGEKLGVTFQQVQKYEKGTNRVSVSAFITICKTLGIEPMDVIGTYFDDKPTKASTLATEVTSLREKLSLIKNLAA